jgi:ketosteroid isomerase-like protein
MCFRCACHALLWAAASLTLGACATPTRPGFDASVESAKLLQRDVEWADAATAGKDVDKIVSYWTDDAVVMEPGQPAIEGKAAIRAFVSQSVSTAGFKIHWVSEKPTFSPDGKLAYMRAVNEMTVPGPNGKPMTVQMQGYSIWRIDSDGQWRCVVDISSEMPAPGVPPTS